MANTPIQPKVKPGVFVSQEITSTTVTPSTPTLPAIVVGILNQIQTPTALDAVYTGASLTELIPNLETAAKINTAKTHVKMSLITVGLLGYGDIDPVSCTVASSPGLEYITANSVPSGVEVFSGVQVGDVVEATMSITTGVNGTVAFGSPTVLKKTTGAFSSVLPGDIISTVYNSTTITSTVLQVADDGVNATLTVDRNLQVGTTVAYSITRKINSLVLDVITGNQLKLTKDLVADVDASIKISRILDNTGTADQPLSADPTLTLNTDYTISTTNFTNDTVVIGASYGISGFTNFKKYPTKTLTGGSAFDVLIGDLTTLVGTGSLFTTELAVDDEIRLDYLLPTLDSGVSVDIASGSPTITRNGLTPDLTTVYSIGDSITVDLGGGNEETFILSAVATTTLTATTNASSTATGLTVHTNVPTTTYRTVATIVDNTHLTVGSAFATAISNSTLKGPNRKKPVIQALVKMDYVAQRTKDANKLLTIDDSSQLAAKVGTISVDNPLGLAASLMSGAAGGNQILAMPIEDDTTLGWLNAIGVLESKDVYHLVPLTQSLTIQSLFKSHVDAMSTSINGSWRVLFSNLAQPTESTTSIKSGGSLIVATAAGSPSTGTVHLYDPTADFTTSVSVGDFIKIYKQSGVISTIPNTAPSEATKDPQTGLSSFYRIYRVVEKVNSSKIKLERATYSGEQGIYTQNADTTVITESATYTGKYEVTKLITKDEEAQLIGTVAQSFSDRRVNYITNGKCVVEINGTDHEVEGFYLAAAIAGLSAATLPHQPLTNYPIPGIKGVRGGSEYFNINQQGVIAAGGGWLVVQDVLDTSLPYTWQQLTTSQGSSKEQEFSFTKNLDEISKAVRIDHTRFPGRNNMVEETINAIETQTRATLETRAATRYNSPLGGFLGPQILSYTVNGVVADPLLIDTVYVDLTLNLPVPLNILKFRIVA